MYLKNINSKKNGGSFFNLHFRNFKNLLSACFLLICIFKKSKKIFSVLIFYFFANYNLLTKPLSEKLNA